MTYLFTAQWMRRISMLLVCTMTYIGFPTALQAGFIPSDEITQSEARLQDLASVQTTLESKLVRERLRALGFTDQEVAERLAQLSDDEMHALATQIDTLTAGGSTVGAVILVLLIVVLVLLLTGKRALAQ